MAAKLRSTVLLCRHSRFEEIQRSCKNAVSIVRNLAAIKKVDSKNVVWALVVLGVVFGLCFNNLGWIGTLPVVANLQYTLAVFRLKDNVKALKISFLINTVLFNLFNLAIFNIVGLSANMVVAVTTAIFLLRKKASV